jgi:hypothetical protein
MNCADMTRDIIAFKTEKKEMMMWGTWQINQQQKDRRKHFQEKAKARFWSENVTTNTWNVKAAKALAELAFQLRQLQSNIIVFCC